MKKILNILLFLFLFQASFAASFTKEQQKQYEDANIYYEIGDYKNALEIYLKLNEADNNNVDLLFKQGVCFFYLRKPIEALSYFERARDLGEKEAYYFLGRIYHLKEEFDKEISMYQLYKNAEMHEFASISDVNQLIATANYAKRLIKRPGNVEIVNLGEAVNTPYHEYAPLVYGAENELFFTSRRPGTTGDGKDPYGLFF